MKLKNSYLSFQYMSTSMYFANSKQMSMSSLHSPSGSWNGWRMR